MASPLSADQIVSALRAEGCKVVEVRSWRTHNRNHKGAWGPVNGVMIHHTVTSGTQSTVDLCYDGRSDLPGPLCLGVIAKDGTVYLVGNGRANHAGSGDPDVLAAVIAETALPAPNERNTDGNARFYGFECINLGDGNDPWPKAQLDAMVRASAALCRAHGWSSRSVIGHKEWTNQKIDPRGFSMQDMRGRVAARLDGNQPEEDVVTPEDIKKVATAVVDQLVGSRRKELVAAIFRTDDVLDAPPSAVAKGNEFFWAQSYLKDTYIKVERSEGTLNGVAERLDSLAVGGVDLDALARALAPKIADELAGRLAE